MTGFFFIALAALIGGALYRLRGSEKFQISRPLEAAAFCSILWLPLLSLPVHVRVMAIVFAWGMSLRGHGTSMDLGTWTKHAEPEWYEYAFGLLKIKDKLSPYWYDALGLAVSGFVVSFFPGLALVAAGDMSGFALMFAGVVKAPAYMAALALPFPKWPLLKGFTEWGEFFFGAAFWAIIVWGWL